MCRKASYSPWTSETKCSVPLGRFRMACRLIISVLDVYKGQGVSRLLKDFQNDGLVRLGRGGVELLDLPALPNGQRKCHYSFELWYHPW